MEEYAGETGVWEYAQQGVRARMHGTVHCKQGVMQGAWILARASLRRQLPTCLQCTPKSSILSSGMVWYSLGPSSGGL